MKVEIDKKRAQMVRGSGHLFHNRKPPTKNKWQ